MSEQSIKNQLRDMPYKCTFRYDYTGEKGIAQKLDCNELNPNFVKAFRYKWIKFDIKEKSDYTVVRGSSMSPNSDVYMWKQYYKKNSRKDNGMEIEPSNYD
jgi:hypothetical protein